MVEIEKERYVEVRHNQDGSKRYLWNRKGFAAQALPGDWGAAMAAARKLNNQADRGILRPKSEAVTQIENRLIWYADRFEAGETFKGLAAQTRLNYRTQLNALRATFPGQKISAFKKRHVKRYLETIESVAQRRVAKVVLLHLFEMALDDEVIDRNPADTVTVAGTPARRQLWQDAQIDAFLAKCDILDRPPYAPGRAEAMRRAFKILEYTGQRPSDMLAMAWAHDDGEFIQVRQRKTGKLVDIYRGELGRMIDAWRAELPAVPASPEAPFSTIVHGPDGRRYGLKWFDASFRAVCDAAEIADLQARDLRRTAVTRLYEAGCAEGLISAITGHDIEACRRILEHYFVRTRAASKEAITRLDDYREKRRRRAAEEE